MPWGKVPSWCRRENVGDGTTNLTLDRLPASGFRTIETRCLSLFAAADAQAFGWWCILDRDDLLDDADEGVFPDPFPTPEAWVQADRHCRRLANRFVPVWAERLNAAHGRSYSSRFWRVMVLNWLTAAIPALWYRWRYTQDFIAAQGGVPCRVAVAPAQDDWRIEASADLIDRFASPAGDYLLTSAILRELAPKNWVLVEDACIPDGNGGGAEEPNLSETWAGAMARRLFGRLAVVTVPGLRLSKIPLSLIVSLLPRSAGRVHYDFSDDGIFQEFPVEFLKWLDFFLPALLPLSFRDGFSDLEAHALRQTYFPGRLLVDQLNAPEDRTRAAIAMAHERGERLVGCQHGGIYGTAKAMMTSAATEYPYHAYLTWGWTEQEDYRGHFVPLPFPALSRCADRHRESGPELLMVGGAMAVRGTRLGWLPKPQQYLRYRRAKRAFLQGLDPALLRQVSYRAYRRGNTDLSDADYMRAAFPDIREHRGELQGSLMRCRLLVLDHPITTMLIAMAANIPTILYWERDAWPLAASAEPYFQRLRDAGILFHDAAQAAAKVNAIWDDVPGWWGTSEVQTARRVFADRYARTSRWWWWVHWLRALWRLSKQSG